MALTPIATHLAELHPAGRVAPTKVAIALVPTPDSSPDRATLEEAKAQGFVAGLASARVEAAHDLALREQDLAMRTSQEMKELLQRLADGFEVSLARMHEAIATASANLLRPMLRRTATTEVVDALILKLRDILPERSELAVTVSGPANLTRVIGEVLARSGRNVQLIEAETVDVTVAFDQTVFETRLADWIEEIERTT